MRSDDNPLKTSNVPLSVKIYQSKAFTTSGLVFDSEQPFRVDEIGKDYIQVYKPEKDRENDGIKKIRRKVIDLPYLHEVFGVDKHKIFDMFKIYMTMCNFLPNIYQVNVLGESFNQLEVIMEHFDCGNLTTLLRQLDFLSEERARQIAVILLVGIEELHSRNIYLGTLNPWSVKLNSQTAIHLDEIWCVAKQFKYINTDKLDNRYVQYMGRPEITASARA